MKPGGVRRLSESDANMSLQLGKGGRRKGGIGKTCEDTKPRNSIYSWESASSLVVLSIHPRQEEGAGEEGRARKQCRGLLRDRELMQLSGWKPVKTQLWRAEMRARTVSSPPRWCSLALGPFLSCDFPSDPFVICLLLAQGMSKEVKPEVVNLAFLVLINNSEFLKNYLIKVTTASLEIQRNGKWKKRSFPQVSSPVVTAINTFLSSFWELHMNGISKIYMYFFH